MLYKTIDGARSSLDIVGQKGGYGMKVAVPANQRHTLRVEFTGTRFRVVFNGKALFEVEDSTLREAGASMSTRSYWSPIVSTCRILARRYLRSSSASPRSHSMRSRSSCRASS